MTTKARKDFFKNYYAAKEPPKEGPPCDVPGCMEIGEFKAPKDRHHIEDHRLLCKKHIEEYNRQWDYLKDLSPEQIEEEVRADIFWRRPAWKKVNHFKTTDFEGAGDIFGFFRGKHEGTKNTHIKDDIPDDLSKALMTMGVSFPITEKELKKTYKEKVKRYHPDLNGGSKQAEEKLKSINIAFKLIQDFLENASF